MKHTIDLKDYMTRCDLISDTIQNKKINKLNIINRKYEGIKVEEIIVDSHNKKEISKKEGTYVTIYFNDVTDYENRKEVELVLFEELKRLINKYSLNGKKVLVVGLGNSNSTPDSLGPKVLENIIVTRHLFKMNEIDVAENFSEVSVLEPGVYATTGIESFDILDAIIKRIDVDYVIAIDSLAASSVEKINKVIQMTTAGIEPGSGIGNNRSEISSRTLKVPVIAIGVPTVVDAVTIVNDTLRFLKKKISYNIMNIDNPKEKLIRNHGNFLDIDYSLDFDERKKYLGLIGELKDDEMKDLIEEVLTPIGYNYMVTPKEVDFLIEKLSLIIANSLNKVFHHI